MKTLNISQEQILSILDACYTKVLEGIPNMKDCNYMASEYLQKYTTPEKAAHEFAKWQIAKCSTSGFLTSLGGLVTLPIAVPTNLVTVWYVQLRMIATIAIMGGYNPEDDEVQTLAYLCLTGSSITKICREAGVQFANKFTMSMIKKIPGEILKKINQRVAFRFITKAGTTGIINLTKLVPIAGGVVGGAVDFIGTKTIAQKSTNVFIKNKID